MEEGERQEQPAQSPLSLAAGESLMPVESQRLTW